MKNNVDQKKKCNVCTASLIVMVLWLLGGLGFFLRVLDKVVSGNGLDYYTTFWGVRFNYVGALVTFACIAVLFVSLPMIYWYSTREERSFKKKYGVRDE
jgi:hypothetical protein